jgi:hypothetical protein
MQDSRRDEKKQSLFTNIDDGNKSTTTGYIMSSNTSTSMHRPEHVTTPAFLHTLHAATCREQSSGYRKTTSLLL